LHATLATAWLGQLKNYEHFFPLLVLPALAGLALWRYRDKDAWFWC